MQVYISKADRTIDVNWDAMPENAKAFIIEYGLRQKLNDAGSSATVKELGADAGTQAFAMAESALAALMEGKIQRNAAKAKTLEEKIEERVIRANFKAICKRPVSQERDDSNEALLKAIGEVLGMSGAEVRDKMEPRIAAEIKAERAIAELKADMPAVAF